MIGIDTNIILRFMTGDDRRQYALARQLFERASPSAPLCVNVVTLTELVWVLESRLALPAAEARGKAVALLGAPEIFFARDNPFTGWSAALESRHRGWTDVVVAQINTELGCSHTFTFDKRAAKGVPGMELLA